MDILAIPTELRERSQWVVWKNEVRKEKRTKVPYQSHRPDSEAASTRPAEWSTFNQALDAYSDPRNGLDGIGFVFTPDDPYVGIDLDGCLIDGELAEWAVPILNSLPSYAEISPSGRGIKIVCRAEPLPKGTKRTGYAGPETGVEMYDKGRYFTITGDVFGDRRDIADLPEAVAALHLLLNPPTPVRERPAAPMEPIRLDDEELIRKARNAANGARFSILFDTPATGGTDSEDDCKLCCHLAYWTGRDANRIERLFNISARGQRDKWRDRPDYRVRTIAYSTENTYAVYDPSYGRGAGNGRPVANGKANGVHVAAEPNRRPDIEITVERHVVVDRCIAALTADPEIYCRGSALVMVVAETADEIKIGNKTVTSGIAGSPKIIRLGLSTIGCFLTKNAAFYEMRTDRRGEVFQVDVHPPEWMIRAVSEHPRFPGIRRIDGIAECPFPRPDGTIVETPGYDAETKTLYIPSIEFPRVPDRPTQEDARNAWGRLKSYIRQFPFATENDVVVWLVGMLNIIGRTAVLGPVPGIAVIGNKAGCGKGLLIDSMTLPGTGRRAPISSYPSDPQEAAKVKTAIVLSGKLVVFFDNLDEGSGYGGSAIDSLVTAEVIDDRVLGKSEQTGEIAVRIAPFLNGNNIAPIKDSWRRWLPIRIITPLEHPESREDIEGEPLRTEMIERRGEIVRDCLIILKSHALAGRPKGKWANSGSFEAWDLVIRGAAWFATDVDCLSTQGAIADDSPERLSKMALLEGWMELPKSGRGEHGVTAAEALRLVESTPEQYHALRSALVDLGKDGRMPDQKRLGNIIRTRKNTIIGGLKFVDSGHKDYRNVCWIVHTYTLTDSHQVDQGYPNCQNSLEF